MKKECWENFEAQLTKSAALLRTDDKRPNDLINVPWIAGKSPVWGVTVVDTLADPLFSMYVDDRYYCDRACCHQKRSQTRRLSMTHHFVPLALESLGPIGSKATNFFKRARSSLYARDRQLFGNCTSFPAPVCNIAVS